jgi:hypothetical protein
MSNYPQEQSHPKQKNSEHVIVHVKWMDSFSLDDTWISTDQMPSERYEVHTVRYIDPRFTN